MQRGGFWNSRSLGKLHGPLFEVAGALTGGDRIGRLVNDLQRPCAPIKRDSGAVSAGFSVCKCTAVDVSYSFRNVERLRNISYASEACGDAFKYCSRKDSRREQVSEGQIKQYSCDLLVSAVRLIKFYTSEMVWRSQSAC